MISLSDWLHIIILLKVHDMGELIWCLASCLFLCLHAAAYAEDGFQRHRHQWESFLCRKMREGSCRNKTCWLHKYTNYIITNNFIIYLFIKVCTEVSCFSEKKSRFRFLHEIKNIFAWLMVLKGSSL